MAALSNLVHPALFYEMCVTMIRMYKDGSYNVIFRNWRRASASSTTTIEPAEPLDYLPAISPTTLIPPELMWEDTETPELKLSEESPFTDDTAVTDANREPGDTTLDASQSQENILAFQGDIYTILRRKRRIRKRINEVRQAKDKLEKAASIIHKKGLGTRPKARGKYGRLMTSPLARDDYGQTPKPSPPQRGTKKAARGEGEDTAKKVGVVDAMSFSSYEHSTTTTVEEASAEEFSTSVRSARRAKKSTKKVVVVEGLHDKEESSTSETITSEGSPTEARARKLSSGGSSRRLSLRRSSKPPTPIRRGSKHSKESTRAHAENEKTASDVEIGQKLEVTFTAGKVKAVSTAPQEPLMQPVLPEAKDEVPAAEDFAAPSPQTSGRDGAQVVTVKAPEMEQPTDIFAETSRLKPLPPPDIIDMYAGTTVQRSVGLKPTSLKMDATFATPWQQTSMGDRRPQGSPSVDEHWPSWLNIEYDDRATTKVDHSTEAELLQQKLASWDPSQEDGYALTPPEEVGEGKEFLEEHDKELARMTGLSQMDFRGGKRPSTESGTELKAALGKPPTSGESEDNIYDDLDWVIGDEDVGQTRARTMPDDAVGHEFSVGSARAKSSSETLDVGRTQPFLPPHAIRVAESPRLRREPVVGTPVSRGSEGQRTERSIRATWLKETSLSSSSESKSSTFLLTTTVHGKRTTKTGKEVKSPHSVALMEWVPEEDLVPRKIVSGVTSSGAETEEWHGQQWVGSSSEPGAVTPTDVATLHGACVTESSSREERDVLGGTESPTKGPTARRKSVAKTPGEVQAAPSAAKPQAATKYAELETTEQEVQRRVEYDVPGHEVDRKGPAVSTQDTRAPVGVTTGEVRVPGALKEGAERGRYKDEGTQITSSLPTKRHRKSEGKKARHKRSHREGGREGAGVPPAEAPDLGGEKPREEDREKRKKHRRKSAAPGQAETRALDGGQERSSDHQPTSLDNINRYLEVIRSREDLEPWPTFSLSSVTSQPRSSVTAQPLRRGEFLHDYATLTQGGEVSLVINANTKSLSAMLWPFGLSPVPEGRPHQ